LGQTLREQSEYLLAVTGQIAAQSGDTGAAFERQARQAAEAATNANALMEAAGRSFGANTHGLREASADARLRIELIASSFRERTGELMNAVSQAATRMAAIGETFERQARELNTVSAESHTRLTTAEEGLARQSALLANASERSLTQARQVGEVFGRQVESLLAAASSARSGAEALAAQEMSTRRQAFLRASRLVIEGLNSLAIDLSRTLQHDLSERILREFVNGDRGVFVRRLLRSNLGESANAVRQKFRDDSDFRRYVLDYLSQFERLRADALAADPENILSATILTSDVGKLYIVLSEMVGKQIEPPSAPPAARLRGSA
jgi:hypothetical protein